MEFKGPGGGQTTFNAQGINKEPVVSQFKQQAVLENKAFDFMVCIF